MYRHQRQVALDTSIPEEETGIRLSLPLNRIARIRFGCYPEFPCVASLLVQSLPVENTEDEDAVIEQETIHIGTIRPTHSWNHLEKRVRAARHQLLSRPLDQFPVFIDFGPLTFHESQSMPYDTDMPWIKEVAIRRALALGSDETHIWGKMPVSHRSKEVTVHSMQSSELGYVAMFPQQGISFSPTTSFVSGAYRPQTTSSTVYLSLKYRRLNRSAYHFAFSTG